MRLLALLASIAKSEIYSPWDLHYARGKLAYDEQRWGDCVKELESAINQRRFWHNSQVLGFRIISYIKYSNSDFQQNSLILANFENTAEFPSCGIGRPEKLPVR